MTETAAPAAAEEAARLLLQARRSRTPLSALPRSCRPEDATQAWAAQRAFVAASGLRPIGWKLAGTSRRAQQAIGVDGPFAGVLFAETSRDVAAGETASLRADDFLFRLIEPEFALRLKADLAPGATPQAVADAVESVHPAIEIVSSAFGARWTEVGGLSLTADNAAHGAFLLGPGQPLAGYGDLLDHRVTLAVDGEPVGSGTGAAVEGGGPLAALAWLANALERHGLRPRAGELVTTGVVTPFVEVVAGQQVEADFGRLGRLALRLA